MSLKHPLPNLPEYSPPPGRDAEIAACVAPLLVLGVFVLAVCGVLGLPAMLALLLSSLGWLVTEMWRFDTAVEAYNIEYAVSFLEPRSTQALERYAADAHTHEKTREFVARYLEAGRRVLKSGRLPHPLP